MSAITDKLNAEWTEKTVDENMFAVRAIIEDFYNNLTEAISRGSALYPTGDATFDAYVSPIVSEMTTFKNQLEASYSEFLIWRQP
jgi:hypothetical protein